MIITEINCSILESTSTSDDDETNKGISKPTWLEPTIKKLMKKTSLWYRAARNFLSMRHNIREKIHLMAKIHWNKWEVIKDIKQ